MPSEGFSGLVGPEIERDKTIAPIRPIGGGESAVTERRKRLTEIDWTVGAFDLIPRCTTVDGGCSRGGYLRTLRFAMIAGGVFVAFLDVADGIDEGDQ